MRPSFTRNGLLLLLVATAFIVSGAFSAAWPLTALGASTLSALLVLYLLFVPTGAMLKRRHLELAWWVPASHTSGGALLAGRQLSLNIRFRNYSAVPLHLSRIRVLCSAAIRLDPHPSPATVPARREVQLELDAVPLAAGYWFFHGLSVDVGDRFGLFSLHVYYPNLMHIKVFPQLGLGRTPIPFRPRTGALHERAGLRTVRQAGLGSDLREIREHIPGDPFKRIAWKASARARKLMVRELESEIMVTHWLALDISCTMREGGPGRSKLDYGLGLCAAFARSALAAGDRVGLLTFDHRIYSQVKPSDGNPQLYRIIDRLMEVNAVVDDDLTDLTEPELVAAVADYFSYQEGIDVRRRLPAPPQGDPIWDDLLIGPHGELYSRDALTRAVARFLARQPRREATFWRWRVQAKDKLSAELRRFCRIAGIEVPYRQQSLLVNKERGLTEAVSRATAVRHSQLVVLVTDLEQLEQLQPLEDALRLARRRGHSLTVVAPTAHAFLEPTSDESQQRVRNIHAHRAARTRRATRRAIERLGVPVIEATPRDALPLLMRRLGQLRMQRAG